ncbi:Protein kinase superfamily protein [Zea mays]|uniref:Protein kinase superfamily protein n=1 Tax=Zea mays TaxID=4577 RepID=A0A1D6HD66_MAIZE|nr:Protein kinase superfamily protein [Zea mays]
MRTVRSSYSWYSIILCSLNCERKHNLTTDYNIRLGLVIFSQHKSTNSYVPSTTDSTDVLLVNLNKQNSKQHVDWTNWVIIRGDFFLTYIATFDFTAFGKMIIPLLIGHIVGDGKLDVGKVLNGHAYNRKCGVYNFGNYLWEIYCCNMPYPDLSFLFTRPEISHCCPSSLANVRCWDTNPDKRPEMAEVVSLAEAIDTSNGGDVNPKDQTQGCLSFFGDNQFKFNQLAYS